MGAEEIRAAQARLEGERRKRTEAQARRPPPAAPVAAVLADGAVPEVGELRGYAAILKQLSSSDPEERRRARFAAADDTRRNLHRFKRKAIPSFPVRLPPESVLMAIVKKPAKKRGASERASVLLFVKWREAVWRAEHANEATLRALFEAVVTFRELELPDFTVEILEHLEVEYEVEYVPAERFAWGLTRLTRDYRTLSGNLRRGSYERKRKPVEHLEDDDTALRAGVAVPSPGSKPDDDDEFDIGSFP